MQKESNYIFMYCYHNTGNNRDLGLLTNYVKAQVQGNSSSNQELCT
jgi:hypothetical protein